jgi:hypothetical protein
LKFVSFQKFEHDTNFNDMTPSLKFEICIVLKFEKRYELQRYDSIFEIFIVLKFEKRYKLQRYDSIFDIFIVLKFEHDTKFQRYDNLHLRKVLQAKNQVCDDSYIYIYIKCLRRKHYAESVFKRQVSGSHETEFVIRGPAYQFCLRE